MDSAGKPIAGARVYALFSPRADVPRATTGSDGRFQFTINQAEQVAPRVAAEADGYARTAASQALQFGEYPDREPPDAGRDLTITLSPDQPIEGQLFDLEGRPVVGAKVHVPFLYAPPGGTLDSWLQAVEAREGTLDDLMFRYLKRVALHDMWRMAEMTRESTAVTDAQGRFSVRGLGRERLAIVRIDGPSIRPLEIKVLTRPGEPFQAAKHPQLPQWGTTTYYGSTLRLTAAPTRPVEGVVREQETGLPIAGARIDSTKLADSNVWNDTSVQATSDAQGRYRLVGLPLGTGNVIVAGGSLSEVFTQNSHLPLGTGNVIVAGPPPRQAYLPVQIEVPNPPGLGTVKLDIELARGVTIRGRITDLRTGKPVAGRIEYHAAADNPNLVKVPGFRANHVSHGRLLGVDTAADGRYAIAGLPGHGALVVSGTRGHSYPEMTYVREFFQSFIPAIGFAESIVKIDIPSGAKTFQQDIVLDPGRTLDGTIVDPEGKPVSGALVYGLEHLGGWTHQPLAGPTFRVLAITHAPTAAKGQAQPLRSLVFLHSARKLAGWIDLKADETGPIQVALQPWASAVGQVVDGAGKPRGDVPLHILVRRPRLGGGQINHMPETIRTGADGRFRLEGLASGLPYELFFWAAPGQGTSQRFAIEPVRPGEARDLGTISIRFGDEK